MSDPPTHYTVAETARLFKSTPPTIRKRCIWGHFSYELDDKGNWLITRESILRHLPELQRRHEWQGR